MIIKSICFLGLFLFAGACNNTGKSSTEISSDTAVNNIATDDTLSSGCYSQIVQRDTSFFQLENKDSIISGSLTYNVYQKDRNDGTLQAELSGDVLTGWYLFRSEGIISVRQVSWKVRGDELWPGMGEVIQKNDTMLFAQPDKLQYDSTRPFKKIPCVL